MTTTVNIEAAYRQWLMEHEKRGDNADLSVGILDGSDERKGVIQFEKKGVIVATVDAWEKGDADFTWMRLDDRKGMSSFLHANFTSENELMALINRWCRMLLTESC